MDAKLKVIDGAKGAVIRLKLPTTIGRGSKSSLKVPSSAVSRSHCEIYEEDGLLAVHDLGSSNGTFVNGEGIDDPTFLYPGDTLRVGDVLLEAIYEADRSLVANDVADEDADTGVTSQDTAAVVAAVEKKMPVEAAPVAAVGEEATPKSRVSKKPLVKKASPKKEVAKAVTPAAAKPQEKIAEPAAEPAAVTEESSDEGFDLDEALGVSEEGASPTAEVVQSVAKPSEPSKPTPKKAPAKKSAPTQPAAKLAAKKPAKKPAAKKPAAPKTAAKKPAAKEAAAVSDKAASLSGVSAIVDYEETEGGSFIGIQAIESGDQPAAEVSSFNIDVGEEESVGGVSGFALDTGEEEQSSVGSGIFQIGDEEDVKPAVEGGDSALNDFFNNLE